MISCIEAVHSVGIVHRDIKPENFCFARNPLNGQLILKIVDFGCSKTYDLIGPLPSKLIYNLTGTYAFIPRAAYLTTDVCPYDDLESVFYVIVLLFGEKLGWSKDTCMSIDALFNLKTKLWKSGSFNMESLNAIFMHIKRLKREKNIQYDQLKDVILEQLRNLDQRKEPEDQCSLVAICGHDIYVRQTVTEHLNKNEFF